MKALESSRARKAILVYLYLKAKCIRLNLLVTVKREPLRLATSGPLKSWTPLSPSSRPGRIIGQDF